MLSFLLMLVVIFVAELSAVGIVFLYQCENSQSEKIYQIKNKKLLDAAIYKFNKKDWPFCFKRYQKIEMLDCINKNCDSHQIYADYADRGKTRKIAFKNFCNVEAM